MILLVVAGALGDAPALVAFGSPTVRAWLISWVLLSVVVLYRLLRSECWRLLAAAYGYLPAVSAVFVWLDLASSSSKNLVRVAARMCHDPPCVCVDAKIKKGHAGGRVARKCVVVAHAVYGTGRRKIIGLDVGAAETEAFWTPEFLRSLVARGLVGVQIAISDAHPGLKAADREGSSGRPGSAAPCTLPA